MRVVIDANVAIAAVAARGLCEAVVALCLEHHEVVLCEGLLREIEEKLVSRINVPAPIATEYVNVLRASATILQPADVPTDACRDPDDLMVLGLIAPGEVDVVITVDKDLLVVRKYAGARILSPRSFWEFAAEQV